jgi:predicted metalloprotease
MRWESERRSNNVEDRRGISVRGGAIGGGAIIIAIVATLMGAPPSVVRSILGSGGDQVQESTQQVDESPEAQQRVEFVKVVLGSTEDVWSAQLPKQTGAEYVQPRLVLFQGAVESACGLNSAAVGPFYCPPDKKVYLDISFFTELARRFGAPGDFAQAYVVGHEVGHHVQNLLGISERSLAARQRLGGAEANRVSVMTELQADCLAGVWAHHANKERHLLEAGDVEEAMRAAAAIGDDTLQSASRGQVVPESFTHGSAEQRQHWLKTGLETGRVDACDTFKTARL